MDIDYNREGAKNWQEYWQELRIMKDTLIWIWRKLMNQRGRILTKWFTAIFIISHIFSIALPWTVCIIINGLSLESTESQLISQGKILMIAVLALGLLTGWIKRRIREYILGHNMRQLDYTATDLFFSKSLGTHINDNNALNDANLKKGYSKITYLEDAMLFEGIDAIMNVLIPWLALWVLGIYIHNYVIAVLITLMLSVYLVWGLFINRKLIREGIPIDQEWREMDRYREERWRQIERVKNNYKEKDELNNLMEMFDRLIKKDRKLWLFFVDISHLRAAVCFFLFFVPLFFHSTHLVENDYIPLGYLFPIFMWSYQLADNLWRIGDLEHVIAYNAPSIHALKQVLTMPDDLIKVASPIVLPEDAPCRIEFDMVSHIYKEKRANANEKRSLIPVLRDVSFIIEPGERVALIGESGAGKTTTKSLLLRYMDPTAGRILIDGIDLKHIHPGSWLTKVGYVPQQAQIMDGTIRYNLEYSLPDNKKHMISETRLNEVVKALQIDFGERLVNGLDTVVGRNGIKISGGQAQRLNIGSEVLPGIRFMIIDEATSSLDAITERLVQAGLEKVIPKNIGVLTITHRLSTVRNYDKFIMLSSNSHGSTIAAQAQSFDELANKSQEFRIMAKYQGIVL